MTEPTRRGLLAVATAGVIPALPPGPGRLPRWRGFNLLEKFTTQTRGPFREQDFDIIAGWGFDFVRLPLHYRLWSPTAGQVDESQLRDIDQAVHWGRSRGIHVCLCLHTAPGYSVDGASQQVERAAGLDLWAAGQAGAPARAALAATWAHLAMRFADVPAPALSFNLVNEPPAIDGGVYRDAIAPAVTAIRARNSGRLIIADGTQGSDAGRDPVPALIPLGIAQGTRGYRPFVLSHYHAPWMFGADTWPVPTWPIRDVINQFLFGPDKPQSQSPLVLDITLAGPATLAITVALVSGAPRLVISADGTRVFDQIFRPGPGPGDWKQSFARPEFGGGYQAIYDRSYEAVLPAGVQQLRIEVIEGDWMSFSALHLRPAGRPEIVVTPGLASFPVPQARYRVAADGTVTPIRGKPSFDATALRQVDIVPWQALEARGVGVHVGEWGANMWTPHAVALAWMHDCLANWRGAGWGWALWNLRGEAGPLDSGRQDAKLEPFMGHRLDRAMLDVLREDR